jgi:hypothetical protein
LIGIISNLKKVRFRLAYAKANAIVCKILFCKLKLKLLLEN